MSTYFLYPRRKGGMQCFEQYLQKEFFQKCAIYSACIAKTLSIFFQDIERTMSELSILSNSMLFIFVKNLGSCNFLMQHEVLLLIETNYMYVRYLAGTAFKRNYYMAVINANLYCFSHNNNIRLPQL